MTGYGLVDPADMDDLIEARIGTRRGDVTLDGRIDGADLSLLAANWLWQAPAVRMWHSHDVTTGPGAPRATVADADGSLTAESARVSARGVRVGSK